MRLKNSIFLWVFPTALLPVAILGLVVTSWSEQRYLREVERDLFANLGSVASSMERRLLVERDIASGLSRVPAVQQFQQMLGAMEDGRSDSRPSGSLEQINRFFETFQSVRTSLDTVRVLDRDGMTLVKVRGANRVPPVFEGLGEIPYVEEEPDDDVFQRMLRALRPDEVGSLLLAGNVVAGESDYLAPVYNTAVPLLEGRRTVGYLTIDPPLEPLNRVLQVVPRLHNSFLLIAEKNPGIPGRDGLLLYDEQQGVNLWDSRQSAPRLEERYPGIYDASFSGSFGTVDLDDEGTRVYFQEFLPYPDQLVSWIIALRVPAGELSAPFENIRIGILLGVLVMLLISLGLARAVARGIAGPVLNLANGLAAFAGGQRDYRVTPKGPDEIREAGRAFNEMADSLSTAERDRDQARVARDRSRRLASLGQMAGGIAHEISNPINTILSLTTLIERELPSDATGLLADVRSIREESERAAATVHAILNFSRMIGGAQSRFDAEDWVRDTVALADTEGRADAAQVDIRVHGRCELEGDRGLLQRALLNLLANAAQVNPPGGRIAVGLDARDGIASIEVADQGPGLDEDQLERAFEPFYTTKPEGQGSGLGLSISVGVVQHHGGTLELGNRPGGGAVARISLPAATGAPGQTAARGVNPPG